MSDMPTHPIRFADLPARKRSHFKIEPDAEGRKALANEIDVLKIPKLRFEGSLIPTGKRDWRIEGTLGATVSQACVVTLEPVTTRIDEDVTRSYVVELDIPDEDEFEIGEDDSADPLPETLDLIDVLAEALVLAMPAYPRKDGVEAETIGVTEPGKDVMTDEDARPFAGLAALRDGLKNKEDTDD
ncbi:Uncharacterized metal-binding protein YceD, DUF177 family [Octadecabacter temperatus]|uniref:Uncharacterized protein n=1 Tax=Octadecabacter temperatus TaxID=1458307 RepID=A0A0K0Y675_9RHOB|nr:DUF177 domain-containing protein [Octadecabacter temperatus]AKS46401.1 hypothetical protein OSB_18600 [Octadecabacter temperatus]SIO13294.1 Uncharacterized metal-binding protein YceD, DUF177 family [Octadecabacter temperatus]